MYKHLWVISGQFKLIYHIKLVRILKYNMFLYYYRVLLQGFSFQVCTSQFTSDYYLYSVTISCAAIKVNKWRSQLELYVSCLCLSFKFNPTPSCKERARMWHMQHIISQASTTCWIVLYMEDSDDDANQIYYLSWPFSKSAKTVVCMTVYTKPHTHRQWFAIL